MPIEGSRMDDNLEGLRRILKGVSRSFYLTLAVLPSSLRKPLGIAYLLARAADTIADTRILPAQDRVHYLAVLRRDLELPEPSRTSHIAQALSGPARNPAERELLARLPECLAAFQSLSQADRAGIRRLLIRLTYGMQQDLQRFGDERRGTVIALESREELDRYTYYAAGCVGECWTELAMAHRPALRGWDLPSMRNRGRQFGQGLQLVNVLRDLAQDLRIGRCYVPQRDLAALGLAPEDLLDSGTLPRLRPLLHELVRLALAHFADGWAYILAIPGAEIRLRLACTWPLLIALRTLERLLEARVLLDPRVTVRISRSEVYGILARSAAVVWSDRELTRYYSSLRDRIGPGGAVPQ